MDVHWNESNEVGWCRGVPVQGWESVCGWVVGIAFIENKKQVLIVQVQLVENEKTFTGSSTFNAFWKILIPYYQISI